VDSAEAYTTCPGLLGTHLDWTLTVEERLDYLVTHTNLTTQIAQLANAAPAIVDMGIPAYQYLNDDQHGVGRAPGRATVEREKKKKRKTQRGTFSTWTPHLFTVHFCIRCSRTAAG
jgi:hypothetical protein